MRWASGGLACSFFNSSQVRGTAAKIEHFRLERGDFAMEFEIEDRPPQMGEDDALYLAEIHPVVQRDRRRHFRPSQAPARQDQAIFIPEQEPGSG